MKKNFLSAFFSSFSIFLGVAIAAVAAFFVFMIGVTCTDSLISGLWWLASTIIAVLVAAGTHAAYLAYALDGADAQPADKLRAAAAPTAKPWNQTHPFLWIAANWKDCALVVLLTGALIHFVGLGWTAAIYTVFAKFYFRKQIVAGWKSFPLYMRYAAVAGLSVIALMVAFLAVPVLAPTLLWITAAIAVVGIAHVVIAAWLDRTEVVALDARDGIIESLQAKNADLQRQLEEALAKLAERSKTDEKTIVVGIPKE